MNKLILVLALVLTACGGGGGGSTVQSNIELNPCTLKTYSSTYPNSYQGNNLIPTPAGNLDNSIMRSVGLKDYHPMDNNNCVKISDHTRLMYKYTLDRLQKINADTVEIYQYGPVVDFNNSTWTTNENDWQIPKSELVWFVQEAHSRNLKVTLVWQLWPIDKSGNTINTNNPNQTEMMKVLNGWHNIIMDMAKLAQENSIDNLYIQWHAFHYPVVSDYREQATQKFITIIDDIRNVFNGKLFMGTPRFYDKRVIEKVDAIVIPLFPSNWSYYDDNNISVSLIKDRVIDAIQGNYLDFVTESNIDIRKVNVIWSVSLQSRNNALSNIWVEDGFCIDNCIQNSYITDFSVQAMAYEGTLQAIKQQTYFKTVGINLSTGYWHTDTLVAGPEGFPNLSQSIRGKPAENIVKYWFSKG